MREEQEWIEALVARQRAYFKQGNTLSESFRRRQLEMLDYGLRKYEAALLSALKQDLGKSPFEAYETEIGMLKMELRHAKKELRRWMEPQRKKTPLLHFPAESRVYREPLGVNLILSPWNYPLQLALAPLVAAISAGNCAVIKPSRHAPNTAEALYQMVRDCFDPEYICVVLGGDECNDILLEQRFDHIFFTGSPRVGKIIMEAASAHLTPVTLELGGKSPCIVDQTAKVDLAARRIVWGKFLNAGQTCVAPDHVWVHSKLKEPLIKAMEAYIKAFYGENPLESKDLPKIVNLKHFHRLEQLLQEGTIRCGGHADSRSRRIEPTVMTDPFEDSSLLKEEIFGPILPVLEFRDLNDVEAAIKDGEKPLSLYLFTSDKRVEKKVIKELSFGGGCINDTIVHLANAHLPFGGVGNSGMGAYHGLRGFETFSHEKSVIKKGTWLDVPLRYPPYGKKKTAVLKKLMK